ncbi:MAG: NADPH:quinone oxidoreductase family protein [Acidimicrobiia bacterium]
MKALVCSAIGDFDAIAPGDLPSPSAGTGQLVLDVHAGAVNFADLLVLQDLYQFKSTPPFAPGMEGVGTVASIGEGVEGFEVGDRVAAVGYSGAFAEQWAIEATNAVPIPADVSFIEAATMTIAYGTSYHALKQRANLQPGESVLVLGAAGGVGVAAIQIAKAMGATVIAAASSDEKTELCSRVGADHVINYTTDDLRSAIKTTTDNRGVDVVYDPVGGSLSEAAFRSLRWRGRHLVIGFAAGDIPSLPMNLPLLKGASLVGVFWGAFTAQEPEVNRQNAAELFELLADGWIAPVVDETHSLENAREALRTVADRRALGRVVVTVR